MYYIYMYSICAHKLCGTLHESRDRDNSTHKIIRCNIFYIIYIIYIYIILYPEHLTRIRSTEPTQEVLPACIL